MQRVTRRQVVQGVGAVGLALGAGCGRWPGQAPPAQLAHIGWLTAAATPTTSVPFDMFRQGLHEVGYVEGQHYVVDWRSAEGDSTRLPELAAELVRLPVDALVAAGGPIAPIAARDASASVPIAAVVPFDPVARGYIATFARPGGNVTGVTQFVVQLQDKRLELLRDLRPGITRIAFIVDPTLPRLDPAVARSRESERRDSTGAALGVELLPLPVSSADDYEAAFAVAAREGAEALLHNGDSFSFLNRARFIGLAAQHRLPVMYWHPAFVSDGGLMAYAPTDAILYRRLAAQVVKILQGTPPGDIPFEAPTDFTFALNLKTAQALGLTIPEHVLLQATEVIQ